MDYSLDFGSHSVFALSYHLVLVVKYRRKIFNNEKIIQEQETDLDHIHILFSSNPKTNLVQFIQHIKGSSAVFLFREFPEIKLYLWGGHLWTPSFFLATTGQVSLNIVKKKIEKQGKK